MNTDRFIKLFDYAQRHINLKTVPCFEMTQTSYWGGRYIKLFNSITLYHPKTYHTSTNHSLFKQLKLPNKYIPLHIIAHEMQHAKQYETGLLIASSDWGLVDVINTWTPTGYSASSFTINGDAYYDLPWEVDANNVATEVCMKYRQEFGT